MTSVSSRFLFDDVRGVTVDNSMARGDLLFSNDLNLPMNLKEKVRLSTARARYAVVKPSMIGLELAIGSARGNKLVKIKRSMIGKRLASKRF